MINIWTSLMIALFILAFAGILYLADRISKFYILKKADKSEEYASGRKTAVYLEIVACEQ